MTMPRFIAEASIYRSRRYREMQVHELNGGSEVVAAMTCYKEGCYYGNPWCACFCDWQANCRCKCVSSIGEPIRGFP